MKHPLIAFWKAIIWALIVINLSLVNIQLFPLPRMDSNFVHLDKIVHAFIYMIQSFLIMEGCLILSYRQFKSIIIASAVSVFYGLLMEFLQYYFFPYRSGDVMDMLANIVGVALGCTAFVLYINLKRKRDARRI